MTTTHTLILNYVRSVSPETRPVQRKTAAKATLILAKSMIFLKLLYCSFAATCAKGDLQSLPEILFMVHLKLFQTSWFPAFRRILKWSERTENVKIKETR